MRIRVEYTDKMIRELILKDVQDKVDGGELRLEQIQIKVKSKNNYRQQEWESGELNVVLEADV